MDKQYLHQPTSSIDSSNNQAGEGSQSLEVPDSASMSDSGTNRKTHSDEEIILASNRPKRNAGRKKFRETRHPVYRGVRKRNNDKWVCELREPNKKTRIWLGTYETAEMAARAHDVAALALRGRTACLNFADSVWRLPAPQSTDAREIRKAATVAAEMFRPEEGGSSNSIPLENDPMVNVHYIDEEEEFGMPGLLASMAEGLLLSPPRSAETEGNQYDGEDEGEMSLWSFSL